MSKGKELFSEKISTGRRTYFFDVKESIDNVWYLVISESRPGRGDLFIHSRIMVFEEHIQEFLDGLNKAIGFIEQHNKPKSYRIEQVRKKYTRAYGKWTDDEDARLKNEYSKGKTISELVNIFQRKPGAIHSRLKKLGIYK